MSQGDVAERFRSMAVSAGRSAQGKYGADCMEIPSDPASLLMSLTVTGRRPPLGYAL